MQGHAFPAAVARHPSRFALVVAMLLLCRVAAAQPADPLYPRLTWYAHPAHQAALAWTTGSAGSSHVAYFDTQAHHGNLAAYPHSVAAARNGRYARDGRYFYHHADLAALVPSTTYYFAVASDGVVSQEYHFVTAPVDARAFKVLNGGDSRTSQSGRLVAGAMIGRLARDNPDLLALFHGGDFLANGGVWDDGGNENWRVWMDAWRLSLTEDNRMLPIIINKGNHDSYVMLRQIFGLPADRPLYYTTRLGSFACINLSTDDSVTGTQKTFLESELRALQGEARWIAASYHMAAYGVGHGDDAGILPTWVPLFEQYNVDVAFESHGHTLKRSVPLRAGKEDPTGVYYVGEGGLGVPQRSGTRNFPYATPGYALGTEPIHVQLATVTAESLTLSVVLATGAKLGTSLTLGVRPSRRAVPATGVARR